MRKPTLPEQAAKKHGSESWTLVRIVSPIWNAEVEPPVRMHAIMVLGHDGHILGSDLVQPNEPETAVLAVLEKALKQPQHGKVRQPTEVQVEDDRLVAIIEPFLKQAVPGCLVTETDYSVEADAVFVAMRDRLNSCVPRESFARAGVSPVLLRDYLRSMLALEVLEPWKFAVEDQLISVTIPDLHIEHASVRIIGEQGQGIMVQEGDDPVALLDFESERGHERNAFRVGMLSSHFVPLLRTTNEMVLEIREAGLVKNEERTPLPAALGPDVCPRLLTERDVILLTVGAKVVASLFETDADLFGPESERVLQTKLELVVGGKPLPVVVTVPHPLFRWDHLPEEEGEEEPLLADPEDKLSPEEIAMVRAFLPSVEDRGEAFSVCAERIIVEIAHYARHTGSTFADWTLQELERFVMEDAFSVIEEGLEHVPEVILALAHWLRKERKPRLDVQAIEKRIRKLKPRFEDKLASRHSRFLA
jgi:hypothetical protein